MEGQGGPAGGNVPVSVAQAAARAGEYRGFSLQSGAPRPRAQTPLDAGGYQNPGAMLPGAAGPVGPLTAALTAQMLQQPSARSLQLGDFKDFQRDMGPRSVVHLRAPEGSLDRFNATGGNFQAESDAQQQDRALQAFRSLDQIAGGQELMGLKKFVDVGKLGNETSNTGVNIGQLGVAERAQQLAEEKGMHDIAMDRQGAKAFDLLAAQGKDADTIKPVMKLRGK